MTQLHSTTTNQALRLIQVIRAVFTMQDAVII